MWAEQAVVLSSNERNSVEDQALYIKETLNRENFYVNTIPEYEHHGMLLCDKNNQPMIYSLNGLHYCHVYVIHESLLPKWEKNLKIWWDSGFKTWDETFNQYLIYIDFED